MPPEVFNSEDGYDLRFDIWSFGVLLYELVSGEPPITAIKQGTKPLKRAKTLQANMRTASMNEI
jgi:serine/threonine protein kinase